MMILEKEIGERPSWDEYFMSIAILTASRSSCRHVEAGSVIVQDKRIVGTGYNGAASVLENCLEFGCRKELAGEKYGEIFGTGNCVGIHSEMNALGHLRITDSKKIELYTTIFPCHTCAKNLLPYGLKKIVFKSFYHETESASTLKLFQDAKIKVYRLNLSPERLKDIIFNRRGRTFKIWDPEEMRRIGD